VEGGGGLLYWGNTIEFFHGAATAGDHQSCRAVLEKNRDLRIDLHPAEISGADHKDLGKLGSNGFDIHELEPVSFPPSPAGPDVVGEDDKV